METNQDNIILMSPLLSEKFENYESRFKSLENQQNIISSKIDNVLHFLENNRKMYINILKSINTVSIENKEILNKNKKLYTEALEKIKNNEKNTIEKFKPILSNMLKNNEMAEKNIFSPIFESRIYNRFWRMKRKDKHQNSCKLLNESNLFNKINSF